MKRKKHKYFTKKKKKVWKSVWTKRIVYLILLQVSMSINYFIPSNKYSSTWCSKYKKTMAYQIFNGQFSLILYLNHRTWIQKRCLFVRKIYPNLKRKDLLLQISRPSLLNIHNFLLLFVPFQELFQFIDYFL